MKAIRYFAEATVKTWAKEGFLFENGCFVCFFKYDNNPFYICRKYDFNKPLDKITWGKGVIDENSDSLNKGAFQDYQFFKIASEIIDKDFDEIKNRIVNNFIPIWVENHHPSLTIDNF